MDYFADVIVRRFSQGENLWVIDSRKFGMYLHPDGIWRANACCESGSLSAVYKDYTSAKNVLEKYKPKPRIGQITPGQKFRRPYADEYKEDVCVCVEVPPHIRETDTAYYVNTRTWLFKPVGKFDTSEIEYVD